MVKISVVVPIFNVEKYLNECIDSLLRQDIGDYEIVCVNDGSPDGSKEIVEEYQKHYPFIKLINQENQGLSVARNTGMHYATGEYVIFVDSDDFICANVLGKLYSLAKGNDLDILDYRVNTYRNGIVESWGNQYLELELPISGKLYFQRYIYKYGVQPSVSAWSHLYRREFLNASGIEFIKGTYFEDIPFTAELYLLANKVLYVNEVVYYYRATANSITTARVTAKHIKDLEFISKIVADLSYKYSVKIPMDNLYGGLKNTVVNSIKDKLWYINKEYYNKALFVMVDFNLYNRINRLIVFFSKISFEVFVLSCKVVYVRRLLKSKLHV